MLKVWCCPYLDDLPFYEILPAGLEPGEATSLAARRWPGWPGIALECEISDVPAWVWRSIPESVKEHII